MTPHADIGAERPERKPFASSILATTKGAFVRSPSGGSGGKGAIEDAAGLAAAGFRWVAFNVGDYSSDEWLTWDDASRAAGLTSVAWARVRRPEDIPFLLADARYLECSGVILNVEQEPDEPRWRLSAVQIANATNTWHRPIAVTTEPWLPDNLGWDLLDTVGFVCLPQAFWNERSSWAPPTVISRARRSFTRVSPLVGVYPVDGRPITPETLASFYKSAVGVGMPFAVYCVDDVPSWTEWSW